MNVTQLEDIVRKKVATRAILQEQLATTLTDIENTTKLIHTREMAQALLQKTAKATQEHLKFSLEDLVQAALDTVFPGVYQFHIEFEMKRGRTEASIFLDKDGERINPMDSSGGGVVDVVSFATRIATWALGNTRSILILDEPFKFLSVNLRPLAGEILKGLSKRLGLQVLMVTHDEEMVGISDRVFIVDQKRRKSIVTVVESEVI